MSKRKQIELSIDKIEEQEKYIESIHMMNEGLFNRTGNRKSYFCTTFIKEFTSAHFCSAVSIKAVSSDAYAFNFFCSSSYPADSTAKR